MINMPGVLLTDPDHDSSLEETLTKNDSCSSEDCEEFSGKFEINLLNKSYLLHSDNRSVAKKDKYLGQYYDYLAFDTSSSSSTSQSSLGSEEGISSLKQEKANGSTVISPKIGAENESPHRDSPAIHKKSCDIDNEALYTDSPDVSDSDLDGEKLSVDIVAVTCPNCATHHVGREILNKIYGIPIDILFTLLFTNSKFMLDLHEKRKTTAVQSTIWQYNQESGQRIRQITYTVALPTNSLGPKVSHVTETQEMAPHTVSGQIYSIDAEACNGGIPYADSFYVSTHWCLTRESSQETRLSVWTQVKYKKSVWGFMKSVIDKNSHNGVDTMMIDLNNALLEEICNTTQQKITCRRRRKVGGKVGELSDSQIVSTEQPNDISAQYQNIQAGDSPWQQSPKLPQSPEWNKKMFYTIVISLLLLLFTNSLLYCRLYSLEAKLANSNHGIDSSLLRIGQAGEEGLINDWMYVLQEQEKIHIVEINRWKESVRDAADHLKQAEEALRKLQISIPSQQRAKIEALLHHLRQIKNEKENFSQTDNTRGPSTSKI